MAEELYFIKTNPLVAKINLYNKLCREENIVINFLDDDKKTSLEIIKVKVKENIERLSKEELLKLVEWFKTEFNTDQEEVKNQLFVHGIDLFYEIQNPVNINNFKQILSDYEKYSHTKHTHISDSEDFNNFLIYGIFFTGLINKEAEKNFLFDFLKSDYKTLYSFAENEVHEKKSDVLFQSEIYTCFFDLYDCTKFYKGSIIELYNFK
ncbi:hypothetical protein QFZ37_001361 [Chryseobacterium ginsenosidimutans]|uniref:hypothetical protein n=1 Tax=Chryseobacterium ginsenosidimutans TaxID=687846 RepID=UPI00277EFDDC|nr:hypothetical protein [Chryseobacterium ginsenosidimutans]MDQ0592992.1 hypothetical protein [Chryseobacterium ginsenosidimutans]